MRAEALADRQQLEQAARIERRRIGRRHAENRLGEAAHLDHRLAVFVVGLGVEPRVARDLAARLVVIVDAPQVVAVRHRRERAVERQQLHAVARQIELADDLRPQQRHDVRADRELEAGKDLFGDGGAAEHVPPLEHQHLPPRPRQIGGAGQPVVAAADDDRVVFQRTGISSGHLHRANSAQCYVLFDACRSRSAFHARTLAALREPQLSRLGGLLRRQRLRNASRARIQRDQERLRADRHLAALQVPRLRAATRCASSNRVITRDASKMARRPGLLHAVVRRRRQGDRRWHGDAAVPTGVSLDRGGSEPAMAHRERVRAERRDRGHLASSVAALALQGPTSARLLRQVCDAPI